MGRCTNDDDPQRGEAASANVEDQLREARSEVFRAYVRVQQQTAGLADDDDEEPPAAGE